MDKKSPPPGILYLNNKEEYPQVRDFAQFALEPDNQEGNRCPVIWPRIPNKKKGLQRFGALFPLSQGTPDGHFQFL